MLRWQKRSKASIEKQKRQLLLHTAGSDVQDIFYTLNDTGIYYKTAVEKLYQYFDPPKKYVVQSSQNSTGEIEGKGSSSTIRHTL